MLSILVVNWNTRDLLSACLSSIERFRPPVDHEVIVVDNRSDDGSAEMVRRDFGWVRLVESDRNLGYAAGNNLAFAAARGDRLLTLNPDTEFVDGSLAEALDVLDRVPQTGCVAVRLVGLDGQTQRSVRGFPNLLGILGDLLKIRRGVFDSYRLSAFDYEVEQAAPQPMGTFLLFRREALASVGDPSHPFDEAFPIFFNEVDLLARLKAAGWVCWYTPKARILHHGGESTKQVRRSMIWESHRSLIRYLRKHAASPGARFALMPVSGFIYAAAFVRAKGYDAGFRA